MSDSRGSWATGEAERRFVERYGALARRHRFPQTDGQLFALLLLSPRSRTLEELADWLQVSHSTVHSSGRRLERIGVVERVTEPGERAVRLQIRTSDLAGIMQDTLDLLREGIAVAGAVQASLVDRQPQVVERLGALRAFQASMVEAINEAIVHQHPEE